MKKLSIMVLGVVFLSSLAAGSAVAGEGGGRERHRIGAYLGLIGDPFPTLVGVNLALNLFSFMRLSGGYGSISADTVDTSSGVPVTTTLSATTLGGGARFFVPGWNLSPVVGLSYGTVTITGSSSNAAANVGGFGASASHMYTTIGLDWQTDFGFNFGIGYNNSLKAKVGGLPFINFGWFF